MSTYQLEHDQAQEIAEELSEVVLPLLREDVQVFKVTDKRDSALETAQRIRRLRRIIDTLDRQRMERP